MGGLRSYAEQCGEIPVRKFLPSYFPQLQEKSSSLTLLFAQQAKSREESTSDTVQLEPDPALIQINRDPPTSTLKMKDPGLREHLAGKGPQAHYSHEPVPEMKLRT